MPGPDAADSDMELLRYVRLSPRPFAKVDDVNKRTSVGYKQTRNRLDKLVEKGLLNVEQAGNVNLYWLSDEGERRLGEEI